jgi:hypothetical protein
VRDARIMTAVPNIITAHPPLKTIPRLFFYDTLAGINFTPEVYVNVSDQFATKKRMLACHESQNAWISDIYEGSSISSMMEIQCRFRGFQAGVAYAEGFRALETWPRAADFSLLPLD